MWIKELAYNLSGDSGEKTITTSDPEWEQIEEAIRSMDGSCRPSVTLSLGEEAHMGIGGGKQGRVIVYATFDGESFHNLLPEDISSGEIEMCVCCFPVGVELKETASVGLAVEAARVLSEKGILGPTFPWDSLPEGPVR